jgi:adenosylcobinamide amidohydrolase
VSKMQVAGHGEAVHLMTSRDVDMHEIEEATSGNITASCLATVGLSNASRIGDEPGAMFAAGTVNVLAHVDRPLTQGAMIEALSVITEARTTAIIDLGISLRGRIVTGTGTDCIVVAAPEDDNGECYAGLHTDIGSALGRAVYRAVKRGGETWMAERRAAGVVFEPAGT